MSVPATMNIISGNSRSSRGWIGTFGSKNLTTSYPAKPTAPPWKCGMSSRGTKRNSPRTFCSSPSGSKVLRLVTAPDLSRMATSPARWLTINRGSIPISEKRPDSSLRSADSKRNDHPSRPIFWNAPTGVSTSPTISATTGIRLPRLASCRNSSREVIVIPSVSRGILLRYLKASQRDSFTDARNDHCRGVCAKRLHCLVLSTVSCKKSCAGEGASDYLNPLLCGCSSVVEHLLAKEDVASSSLVTRCLLRRAPILRHDGAYPSNLELTRSLF